MNKYILLTLMIIAICITISCGSCKAKKESVVFTQSIPFTVENTYSQKWVAGVRGGGSGLNIHTTINNISEGVIMKEFFFRKKVTEVKVSKNNLFSGYYKNDENTLIMDSDTQKEVVNTPPKKSPFQLEDNEAVLSYDFNNKTYYHKISNIVEKDVLAYPSSNPNN